MLRFNIFGIPVEIQPWFWLVAAFVSGALSVNSADALVPLAGNMGMVLVSILVHELGHCWTLRRLGARPVIILHGFGGAAMWRGMVPNRPQQVAISLSGPAAGFLLAALLAALSHSGFMEGTLLARVISFGVIINVFWNILNLLPIQPLDGGHVLAAALGRSGLATCRIVGAVCAAGCAILFLAWEAFFAAVFFGFLAYANWTGRSLI